MRITQVEFKDFCQFEALEETLGPGLIGVLGKNGAGKSNFLRGIRRAITGISGNVGNKEDDLRWGATRGHVRVGFTVNANEAGWIQRNIASAGGRLHFGDRDHKTHAEIENKIYDILNVNPIVLSKFVFVDQGQIESILFEKQAERQKALQNLFGTQQAELIREYLQAELNSTVPTSRAEAIQQIRTKLSTTITTAIQDNLNLKIAATALKLKDGALELYRSIVSRREAQQATLRAAEQATEQVRQYTVELAAAQESLGNLKNAAIRYADILTSLEPLAAQSHKLVERDSAIRGRVSIKASAESMLGQALKIMEELPPPRSLVSPESIEKAKADYNQMLGRIEVSYRLSQLKTGAQCPTCNQLIDSRHIESHRQLYEKLKSQADESYQTLTQLQRDMAAELEAHQTYRSRQEWAVSARKLAEETLASIPELEPVIAEELQNATETIEMYQSTKQTYQELSTDVKLTESKLTTLNDALDRARATSTDMAAALGELVTEDAYQEAQGRLQQHEKASQECSEVTGRLAELQQQKEALQAELAKYEAEEQKLACIKVWRDQVERARGLLHREQLPAVVARFFLDSINRHLARYLELFEVPFTAKITSDEVICGFSGKADVPAGRLSGGQKVMLGLAFRFAIYDQFVSSLGVLMLDEPTVYLDDDHVEVAVEMFNRIKSYSKSAGLQLIVVTHDQRLASVFDQVIRI